MKRIIVLIVGLLIMNYGYCQRDISNKRPAFDLKLFVNEKQFYSAPMGETNYVVNDSIIQIFPGETLYVETEIVNHKLTNFRVVHGITDSTKTLIIDFHQVANGKVHEQMMLTINNPFNEKLHYKALMNLMKNQKWVNTSVYPVMPKLQSMEMWPDLITSLVLTGFELKEND